MSTMTTLTVNYPAPSSKGSEQFTYPLDVDDAIDRLVQTRFPAGTWWVPVGHSWGYLQFDGSNIADVDILTEVVA